MLKKIKHHKSLTSVPPWIFIGAAIILLPLFSFMTFETVNRQKKNNIRLLSEKGAALIRSFEAGTRTGMMGMRGGSFRLQRLLSETAQQADIVYILVADLNGTILAHNDSGLINTEYGKRLDLAGISQTKELRWRIVAGPDRKIFEVYRRFSPIQGPKGGRMGHMMFQRSFRPDMTVHQSDEIPSQIIFVGLDMTSIETAQKTDIWHAVVMGAILLLIGFAGIILLFLAQGYQAAKISLSRVQAFSDNVVENMPIGLIALDTHRKIVSINYVACSVFRLSLPNVIGKDVEQILPTVLRDLIDSSTDKGVIEKEIDCPANGQNIPLEVSASVLKDESGNFYGYVLLFKDLSEVRTLRKEIARNQRLATVGRLAAGVAHEIRNPLSSIKGFATYFKERYRKVPEDQHIADIMIQEVDRLNRVIGQLLEFARPVSISKKPVPTKSFIEDSLKLVERQAKEKNIRIETKISSGIDSVFIDADKINQVLLNLYLNAIDAMDSVDGKLSVSVDSNLTENQIMIRITDNGVGIGEADLAHIFDPYFTTKASGTGLGLAIAHKILEVHKGEIKIDSRTGKGATVTILLPRLEGKKNQ